jgi:hypothetical protein
MTKVDELEGGDNPKLAQVASERWLCSKSTTSRDTTLGPSFEFANAWDR